MITRIYNILLAALLVFSSVIIPSKVFASQSSSMLWSKLRKNFRLKTEQSLEPAIRQQIRWHQAHPDAMTGMSDNARLYLGYVMQETANQNLPAELALIPFIESNFNPFAQSPKGASGLWQMMPEMASASNLVINHQLDERRDVIKSTEAALKHLRYLHGRLDNRWDYAIAAYNAGEGRVRQAVRQAKRSNNKVSWVAFLPAETRKYLPKLYALKRIINQPDQYGIVLPDIATTPYILATPISRSYAFDHLSELCKIDGDDLHKLNPSWKGNFINHDYSSVVVLPKKKAFACQKKIRKVFLFNNRWAYHKVKKSDTLASIASLYQTSIDSIMLYNGLSRHTIYPNKHLIVRRGDKKKPTISSNTTFKKAILSHHASGPLQIQHHVKSGDTIQSVSKQYALKLAHIAYWNQLKYPYYLEPGQVLVLWRHDAAQAHYFKHVVKSGDTVSSIAKYYKISQKQLLSANKIENINKLKVNQVLTIRKS